MASKKSNIEIILSAKDLNLSTVITKGRAAIKAFTDQAGSGAGQIESMRSQVLQLAGAFAGLQAIGDIGAMLQEADRNAYGLSASLKAANREFAVGSAEDWEQTITELSDKLKIYSKSDIKGASAATIDMTKRLGLNADQMKNVIALSGDLAAGRTDLAGAVERVTAALRGEAEASEYLGLTLNETYVKGWYEQRGALQGAWKDLTDLEKAQVRYNVFLEQALPLQGKAAESINTYDGAIQLIRKTVADSIADNEDLLDSLKQVATVLRENADEIGAFVGSLASGAADVIEFVAENRELILTIGKYGLIFGVATSAIGRMIKTVQGLNAAFVVLTGTGIIPWIRSIGTACLASVPGAASLTASLAGVTLAAAGFLAAYKLGEWLTMGKELRELAAAQGELERATKKVNTEFKNISDATGVTVTSMEELDQAVKEGRIHYDELTGTWKKGAKEQQQATEQTATVMKQATGDALKEMQEKYQDYAKEIRRIQGEIYGREKSLAAELREMSRSGMSDYSAWQDRKNEAEEYATAAKQAAKEAEDALKSGDTITAAEKWKEALQYADDSKAAYKDLNKEVKDGEQVVVSQQQALKTAMDGVKSSGELAISILKQQQKSAGDAMDALTRESGWQNLAKSMDKAEQTWLTNWKNMQDFAAEQVETVSRRIDAMVEDRHVTVWVTEQIRKAEGGMVRLAGGGMVPGYSPHPKADNINAKLTAREFVEPVAAVDHYEPWVFEVLRHRLVDRDALHTFLRTGLGRLPHFGDGGMAGKTHFSTGGMVASASGDTMNVNLNFPTGSTVPVKVTKTMAREMLRQFEQLGLRMSA